MTETLRKVSPVILWKVGEVPDQLGDLTKEISQSTVPLPAYNEIGEERNKWSEGLINKKNPVLECFENSQPL